MNKRIEIVSEGIQKGTETLALLLNYLNKESIDCSVIKEDSINCENNNKDIKSIGFSPAPTDYNYALMLRDIILDENTDKKTKLQFIETSTESLCDINININFDDKICCKLLNNVFGTETFSLDPPKDGVMHLSFRFV